MQHDSHACWLMQARPEDADKKFEERKHWDDTVKAKEEDLARIGLDDKKVSPSMKRIPALPSGLISELSSSVAWQGLPQKLPPVLMTSCKHII